jgi:hypothetical protein
MDDLGAVAERLDAALSLARATRCGLWSSTAEAKGSRAISLAQTYNGPRRVRTDDLRIRHPAGRLT